MSIRFCCVLDIYCSLSNTIDFTLKLILKCHQQGSSYKLSEFPKLQQMCEIPCSYIRTMSFDFVYKVNF